MLHFILAQVKISFIGKIKIVTDAAILPPATTTSFTFCNTCMNMKINRTKLMKLGLIKSVWAPETISFLIVNF